MPGSAFPSSIILLFIPSPPHNPVVQYSALARPYLQLYFRWRCPIAFYRRSELFITFSRVFLVLGTRAQCCCPFYSPSPGYLAIADGRDIVSSCAQTEPTTIVPYLSKRFPQWPSITRPVGLLPGTIAALPPANPSSLSFQTLKPPLSSARRRGCLPHAA